MGLSDEEKNMAWCVMTGLSSPRRMDITPANPTPPHLFPSSSYSDVRKWLHGRGVWPPLGPHFRLSTDSPLPRGEADLFSRLGMTTQRTVKYAHRKGPERGKSRPRHPATVVLCPLGPAFLSSAAGEQERVDEMISIKHNVNHYCSEQKSS